VGVESEKSWKTIGTAETSMSAGKYSDVHVTYNGEMSGRPALRVVVAGAQAPGHGVIATSNQLVINRPTDDKALITLTADAADEGRSVRPYNLQLPADADGMPVVTTQDYRQDFVVKPGEALNVPITLAKASVLPAGALAQLTMPIWSVTTLYNRAANPKNSDAWRHRAGIIAQQVRIVETNAARASIKIQTSDGGMGGVNGQLIPATTGMIMIAYLDKAGAGLAEHLVSLDANGSFKDSKPVQGFVKVRAIWMGNRKVASAIATAE
jgi:hypothetical protein